MLLVAVVVDTVSVRGWNPDQEVHLVWVPSFKGLSGLVSGLVSGLGVH